MNTPPVFLHAREIAALTSTLTPEAVAQMVADREAGTPGPWRFDGPVWNQIVWTDGDNRLCFMAHSNGLNDDRDIANASRITRLPDLEAAYLTLAAENATLRVERDDARETLRMIKAWDFPGDIQDLSVQIEALRASEAAALERAVELERLVHLVHGSFGGGLVITFSEQDVTEFSAALTPTADKEPKT